MTPEQINRAIAEHLGWHNFIINDEYGNDRALRPGEKPEYNCIFTDIPNYCADLNEMHEAEKTLDEEQTLTQIQLLLPPPFCDKPSWRGMAIILQATASQRAEAFLRTVGKWKE